MHHKKDILTEVSAYFGCIKTRAEMTEILQVKTWTFYIFTGAVYREYRTAFFPLFLLSMDFFIIRTKWRIIKIKYPLLGIYKKYVTH